MPLLINSTHEGQRIFFVIGGVAALTLLINGTFAKFMLESLQLVKRSTEEMEILQHYARKRIHHQVQHSIKHLRKTSIYYDDEIARKINRRSQAKVT